MICSTRAPRREPLAPATRPASRTHHEGAPGHRSGEGSADLWEHIRDDNRQKPAPPPIQEQEQR
jgi:hypothetical protein